MDISADNKRIVKNTLFLYIRMILVLLLSLYISRVILKVLGVEDYGIYNVVAGFVTMFGFLNNSLTSCIQRLYNVAHGQDGDKGVQNVYNTSFYIQLALAVLLVVIIESIGLWFLNNKLVIPIERMCAARWLFQMTVVSLLFVVLQVPFSSAVMAYENMDYYAIVGIVDIVLKLVSVVLLPFLCVDNLIMYGVFLAIVSIIDFFMYYAYCKVKYPFLCIQSHFDTDTFKEVLSFSSWSIFGSLAIVARNQGLNIVLNMFFGPIINAARGLSFQVKSALISFTSSISTASKPQMVEAYAAGDYLRATHLLFFISKVCFLLLYVMALPVAGEVEFLLHLWLGNEVPDYTAIFTVLILVISLIDCFNGHTTTLIYAGGRISMYNIVTAFLGLLVIPFSYILLKYIQNPFIVYAVSIAISLFVLTASIWCQRILVGIPIAQYVTKVILPCLFLVVVTFWIPIVIRHNFAYGFVRFLINTGITILSVTVSSFFVLFSTSERSYVNSLLTNYFKKRK